MAENCVKWKILLSCANFCCSLLTVGQVFPGVRKEHEIIQSQLKNGERPYNYFKRAWLRAQICQDEKSIFYYIKTNFQVDNQVREDTLTKEDTLPKLKLKTKQVKCVQLNLKWLRTISYLVMLAKKY